MGRIASAVVAIVALPVATVAFAQGAAEPDAYHLGIKAYLAGDHQQAHDHLSQAVAAAPDKAGPYYYRGLCLLALGRPQEANEDFARGVQREQSGHQFRQVGRELARVQGSARQIVEQHRSPARSALAVQERQRVADFLEQLEQQSARRVAQRQAAQQAEAASVAAAPGRPDAAQQPPPAGGDPFSTPAAPAVPADNPFAPSGDSPAAMPPANPFAAPTETAASSPFTPSTPPAAEPAGVTPAPPTGSPLPAPAAAAEFDISAPDGIARMLSHEMSQGRPGAVWTILPQRYREDIQGLLAELADKMDPEVWDKSFVLLGKLAQGLRDKQHLILGTPLLAAIPEDQRGGIALGLNMTADMLDAIARSQINTVEGLKTADPGKLLDETLGVWVIKFAQLDAATRQIPVEESLAMLAQIDVTVTDQDGDTATLHFEQPNVPPFDAVARRVDGVWLPAIVVDAWDEQIAMARGAIGLIDMSGPQKMQAVTGLAMAEGLINQMLAIETQEEFDVMVNGLMAMVPMPAADPAAPDAPPTGNPLGGLISGWESFFGGAGGGSPLGDGAPPPGGNPFGN